MRPSGNSIADEGNSIQLGDFMHARDIRVLQRQTRLARRAY